MKLEKCTLKNIGCFQEKSVEFSDLTIIFGENRTGKSTLVYALFFALFGKHLNSHLRLKDLCQKGKDSGEAELSFTDNNTKYVLRQFTDRLPEMFIKSGFENEYNSVSLNDPDDMKTYIPIDSETASLTSFFRESELIYFLQDIPKYNKTLLQSLIGMDQALIVRSRFKKALTKARDFRKAVVNAAPKQKIDILSVELSRRKIDEAEKELHNIEIKYRSLIINQSQDPTIYKLLQNQYKDKKKQQENLIKMKKNFPGEAKLEKEKIELEKGLILNEIPLKTAHELGEDIKNYMRKGEQLEIRKKEIMRLEKDRECPLCAQIVPKERLSSLLSELELKSAETMKKQKQIKEEINKLNLREKQKAFNKQSLEKISSQLKESRFIDMQIKEIAEQLSRLELDLKQFESLNRELKDTENMISMKAFLENRRDLLQKEIIHNKVIIKQYEDILKSAEENKNNQNIADRQVLVCKTAYESVDEAIQSLGHSLLDRIRQSIQKWSGCFTFLNQFDIKIGDKELLPVIQAKGYQYKLNQMSKSERIFLYLLLKLAIGDALGHLDLFILDDPADGLDFKRKQTLAYLLAEVAKKRQVIVTTNDISFAELFSGASRINL